ncbi:MAG: glycosyltransferase family 1 protein [Bacteroidota bacterium]
MKKIKILVDARVLEGEGQGSATYIKGLYNALAQKHPEQYDIYITGYTFDKLQEHFPFLEYSRFIQLERCSTLKRLFVEFPNILKVGDFDYAHFQYIVPFRGKGRCRFIVTIHDILFNDFPEEFSAFYRVSRNFLFQQALQKSEIVLTVSNYSKERIAAFYKADPNRIHITPNAIDQRYLAPYDKIQSIQYVRDSFEFGNYILYVSRVEPRKNHHLLLKAFRELQLWKQGIHLVCIGNETLKNPLFDQQIEDMRPEEKVAFRWIKYVNDHDLLELYRAARLFVYPSKAEGFGIPPIEAAALAVPTLCSRSTAMEDFDFLGVQHQFDPAQYKHFKDNLQNAIARPFPPSYWQKIAQEVTRRYSWQVAADVLHDRIQAVQQQESHPTTSGHSIAS